ncbi:MAG TPA: nuclear transport factor 2 family protein [Gemmatimonadaceae bacterium]|jgi:hypothetical protein|nr:nuclear transport factor 2 family protein [Gemmatimonadaceae bacterium]
MPLRSRAALAPLALALAAASLATSACTTHDEVPSPAERAAIADTLKSMIVKAYDLTAPGDRVGRMLSLYPSNGPVASASGGLMSLSRDSLAEGVRAFWQYVGQNMRDPKWTWEQFHVDVLGRNAAAVTATYRVPHRTPRGEPHVIAGALTMVFARRDGRWVVVQEHLSDRAMDMGGATGADSGASAADSAAMPPMDMSTPHAH